MLHYCLPALLFSYIITLIFYSISQSGGQLKGPPYHVDDKDSITHSRGQLKKPPYQIDEKEIFPHKLPRRPSNYTLRKVRHLYIEIPPYFDCLPPLDGDKRSSLLAVLSSRLQLGLNLEHGGQPGGGEVRHGAGHVHPEHLELHLHPARPQADCYHANKHSEEILAEAGGNRLGHL